MSWFFSKSGLQAETIVWRDAVIANGGGFEANSIAIADDTIRAFKQSSMWSKLVYYIPIIGDSISSFVVPLIDSLGAGNSTSTGFVGVGTDAGQNFGIEGNGVKYFTIPLKPSQLGTSSNGGIGVWILTLNEASNQVVAGCMTTGNFNRYLVQVANPSTFEGFCWGATTDYASTANNGSTGLYYGQSSATNSRELFKDGVSIATSTTTVARTGAGDNNIIFCGSNNSGSVVGNSSRVGLFMGTTGDLTPTEAAEMHTILAAQKTALGR